MTEQPNSDNRPESDYSRKTVRRSGGMRTGYTTGSCAAAAAKAATLTLLTNQSVSEVTIHLPVGRDVTLAIHRCEWVGDDRVICSVIKDGGDDPDVTHGAERCVTVSRTTITQARQPLTCCQCSVCFPAELLRVYTRRSPCFGRRSSGGGATAASPTETNSSSLRTTKQVH